jgi:hypothetical protein
MYIYIYFFCGEAGWSTLPPSPQPGGPGLCIYILHLHGGLVIPPDIEVCSLFVALYHDSRNCCGGILTRLHMVTSALAVALYLFWIFSGARGAMFPITLLAFQIQIRTRSGTGTSHSPFPSLTDCPRVHFPSLAYLRRLGFSDRI